MPNDSSLALKTVLLDMDGVIWRGYEPVLDIQKLFEFINHCGCQVYCVTNNSTSTVNGYLDKLKGFGVDLDPSQIITSAEATACYLSDEFPESGSIFVVGEEGLKNTISSHGFQVTAQTEDPEIKAVVVGLDLQLTYQKIFLAANLVRNGVLFIGTNPDKTFPAPMGIAPGAGAIISPIEVASGIKPLFIGKPEKHLYLLALKRSGSLPEETLMIGDRLETDILGAQRLGIRTGLVLTGIASRNDGENWAPGLDIIGDTALEILEKI